MRMHNSLKLAVFAMTSRGTLTLTEKYLTAY